MRIFTTISMLAIIVLAACAGVADTLPQQQASNLAVPDAPVKPVGAVEVMMCKRLIVLGFIDSKGGYHDVDLTHLTLAIVRDLEAQVPADNIVAYTIDCGNSDGTPL